MKPQSMYLSVLFVLAVNFAETRRQHHRDHFRKLHPCPIPGGHNGICVPSNVCEEPADHLHPNWRKHRFCGFRRRSDNPVVCCLKTTNRIVAETPPDSCNETPSSPDEIPVENVDHLIEEKCAEYTKVAMDVDARVETDGPPRFVQPFVVGGTASLAKEFPHMALLGYGDESNIQWMCGGSLISDKFVLTAAHCIYSTSNGDVNFVRLGDLNVKSNTDDAKPQQIKVAQTYGHPDYISGESQYNDIALVELEEPATFNKFVRPACIETSDDNTSKLVATGWGTTEFGGATSEVMQKVDLVYYSYEQCNQTFGPQMRLERGIDEKSQLCAGGFDGQQKDTCQGDSGGPLQTVMYDSPKMYKIVGVTSFGKGCGLQNTPGVYTKVSHFCPWIADIIWLEN